MGITHGDNSQLKKKAIKKGEIFHRAIFDPDVTKKQRQERVKKINVIRNANIS